MEHHIMTDNRRLIIRVSPDSLSFSTREAEGVVHVSYALNCSISMAANLREALHKESMLSQPFERTLVMVDSPVLMEPTPLFREEEQEQLYHHAFSRTDQLLVMHTVLPDLDSVAIFSIQKDLYTVCKDAFERVQFMPAVAPVWRHLHQRSYTGQRQKLYGYFHEHRLEIFSFAQNRFRFCNSYTAQNPNDALYYLLSVWKQLAMSPEHDELHIAGDIPEREQLVEEAQKFVKRVFYINPSGEFNRAQVTQIAQMPYDLMVLFVKGK
ncbi:MAG: DUF3822 family protein [Prevotella sp.]|nr:DUF3822 family protein [Prevotella sp.]